MGDDDARKKILARRAQFVAAAVAGLVACDPGPDAQPPNVCLSIAVPPPWWDAGPTVVDAGAMADPDASADNADAEAPPQPCLSVAPPEPCLAPMQPPLDAGSDAAPPRPCLKMQPPKPPPTSSTPSPKPRICLSLDGDF